MWSCSGLQVFSFTHEAGENPVFNVDMVEPEKEGETSEDEI